MFGGDRSSLVFIDIENRKNLGIISGLAVKLIYSIELCRVKKNNKSDVKILLTITGRYYNYSYSKTDVLDITKFIKSGENNGNTSNNQNMIKRRPYNILEMKALEDN